MDFEPSAIRSSGCQVIFPVTESRFVYRPTVVGKSLHAYIVLEKVLDLSFAAITIPKGKPFSIGIRMARVKSRKFTHIQLLVRGIIVESARVHSLIDEGLRTNEYIEVWVSFTLRIVVNFVLHDTSRFFQRGCFWKVQVNEALQTAS